LPKLVIGIHANIKVGKRAVHRVCIISSCAFLSASPRQQNIPKAWYTAV